MPAPRIGNVNDSPPSLSQPPEKINFLEVQAEPFVESANGVEVGGANRHDRTRKCVYRGRAFHRPERDSFSKTPPVALLAPCSRTAGEDFVEFLRGRIEI